jgi:hypothetical protein
MQGEVAVGEEHSKVGLESACLIDQNHGQCEGMFGLREVLDETILGFSSAGS